MKMNVDIKYLRKIEKNDTNKNAKNKSISSSVSYKNISKSKNIKTEINVLGLTVQVQIGSMKIKVDIKYLRKIEKNDTNKNAKNKSISSSVSYKNISKSKNIKTEINVLGLTVDEATLVVDKFLDDCSIANLQTVRIIHGKGTGKLKNGIHQFLKSNSHVKSFRLGTFGEGEMGVTVVELR